MIRPVLIIIYACAAYITSSFVETPYLSSQLSHPTNTTHQHRMLDNQLDYPAIISLPAQPNSTYYYAAFKYILSNLSPTLSQFILYPFPFTLGADTYPQGAFISTVNSSLPSAGSSNYFLYLNNATSINFGSAKALYDINIAILKVVQATPDGSIDLTYESSYYCSVLTDTLSKYSDCLDTDTYADFKSDVSNTGKSYLMYASETEVQDSTFLYGPSGLNFGMLIISDYILGNDTDITNAIGAKGIANIKKYVQNGGIIYSSGKGGYLLEKWGIYDSGTFNTSYLLTSVDTNSEIKYGTCLPTASYTKMLLCHNAVKNATTGSAGSYLLSSFFMSTVKSSTYTILFNIDGTDQSLRKKDANTGEVSNLTTDEKQYLPFAVTKSYGKGTIYHLNANPLFKGWYGSTFYNYFLLAMGKPIIFDTKIQTKDNLPLPAGEAGVNVGISYSFYNLFDTSLTNFTLKFIVPDLIDVKSYPASCTLSDPKTLVCTQSSLSGFSKYQGTVYIEITNANVTQVMNNIVLLTPSLYYYDSSLQRFDFTYSSIITDAKLSALLRGTLNIDNHALPGHGLKSDIVLNIENKEDTEASEVEYIAVAPLISPVVNNIDKKVGRTAEYYASYYSSSNIEIPFNETGDSEIIDFQQINSKNAILIPDFDMPVKQKLLERTDSEYDSSETVNINSPSFYIPNLKVTLKQICYLNPETFFDFAIPRLLIYIDTNKENGTKAIYPNGIPLNKRSKSNINVEKKRYLFTRVDVSFYETKNFITLDRYHPENVSCVNGKRTYGSDAVVNGSFGANGLVETEYSNGLLAECNRTPFNYSKDELIAKSNSTIFPTTYLYQINDAEVSSPEDIMEFKENADATGYHQVYPEIQYIFAHTYSFELNPNETRLGGKMLFTLPVGIIINGNCTNQIVYSADHVGFYKTECNASSFTSYFRRGNMPNEAYGKATIVTVTLQNLNTNAFTFSISADLFEFKFDLSSPLTSYEQYTFRHSITCNPERRSFFKLPAAEIHFKLTRKNSTILNGYELMDPYARYGIYIQELVKHRPVWTPLGTRLPSDPGLVLMDAGINTLVNLGTLPTPFAEYLTVASTVLPLYSTCSRIEWKDLWGRKWMEPMRTLYIESTPLPGPIRNFMMSTTYELLNADGKRLLNWNSDKSATIRVQIKLQNMYPKYFPLTVCKDIEVGYMNTKSIMNEYTRIYTPPPYGFQITSTPDTSYFANLGHRSFYGYCYDSNGTVMAGNNLTASLLAQIGQTYLCSETYNETLMKECQQNNTNLPQLHIRPSNDNSTLWNYSPDVDKYFPKNYIKPNMWDMTHYDYEDNFLTKGYKLHQDNGLPSIEVGPPRNPAYYKPHNIIAQPIFKGLGYNITYSSKNTNKKYANYSGWWTDNLQNRDHTLLAGQNSVNDVSVDKQSLIDDSNWVLGKDVKGADSLVSARLKNIYACLYNRYKLRINITNQLYTYPANVYQNNIVPIIPDLTANDDRLTMYNCTGSQYSPYNISQVSNIVYTPTDRDWLYFAAGLRANSMETINILYTISPINGVMYEGHSKINDGARFVYWNPSGSTSQFMIVDNPVNIVDAIRNDLTINAVLYPTITTTFSSVVYQVLTVSDPSEVEREWKDSTYVNHYGFGDSTVSVYVGGIENTKAIVNPGESTYAKITLYNNAGFDWNLKYDAISYANFVYESGKPFLKNYTIFVSSPTDFKFIKLTVPESIANYISIIPSNVKDGVRSQFSGFDNFNVATIRDGFKGDYYYKISILGSFPLALQGNVFEIEMEIVSKYFDRLPGYNDPTSANKYHDYTIKMPPIKFAVPFQSGNYSGKAYFTSGYSTNLKLLLKIPSYYTLGEIRAINDTQINSMSAATADQENVNSLLKSIWDSLPAVNYTRSQYLSYSTQFITYDLTNCMSTFPVKGFPYKDISKLSFVAIMNATQLEYGTRKASFDPRIYYNDYTNITKNNGLTGPNTKNVESKGAWLIVRYSYAMMRLLTNGTFINRNDTRLYPTDSGYMKVVINAKNVGNKEAYNVNYTLFNGDGVNVVETALPSDFPHSITSNSTTLMTQMKLPPGEQLSETIYIQYQGLSGSRKLTDTSRNLIKYVTAAIDLNSKAGDVSVQQNISSSFLFTYTTTGTRETVALSVSLDNSTMRLKASSNPSTNVTYSFYRFNATNNTWVSLQEYLNNTDISDGPFDNYTIQYQIGKYKVESYNQSKAFMAEDFWVNSILFENSSSVENRTQFVFPLWAIIVVAVGGAGILATIVTIVAKKKRLKTKVVADLADSKYATNHESKDVTITAGEAMIKSLH